MKRRVRLRGPNKHVPREIREPNGSLPLDIAKEFDPAYYATQVRDLTGQTPSLPHDPLTDYLMRGWRDGLDPCRWFSTSRYLEENLDVIEADINPFLHYIRYGRPEGRAARSSQRVARLLGTPSYKHDSLVVLVTDELPGSGPSGGIGSAMQEMAELCRETGQPCLVLWCPHDEVSKEVRLEARVRWAHRGLRLEVVDVRRWTTGAMPQMRSYAVHRHLSEIDDPISVIHFAEYQGLGFHTIRAKRHGHAHHDTELVVQLHGGTRWALWLDDEPFSHENQLITDFMERESIAGADRLLGVSEYLVSWYRDRGILSTDSHTAILPNVLSDEWEFIETTPTTTPGMSRPVVVMAHASHKKGLPRALEALRQAANQGALTDTDVYFIGSLGFTGPDYSAMLMSRELTGTQLRWHMAPGLTRFEVRSLLSSLRDPIVVVPSARENCPYAVMENVALGLQVISSADGGGPEPYVLDSETRRLFFDPDDRYSLAECIRFARANPHARLRFNQSRSDLRENWKTALARHADSAAPFSDLANWPSVTLALVHFRRPHKLLQALHAAARSDYPGKLELLVIDDSGESGALPEALIDLMTNRGVRLLSTPDVYLGAARNSGLAVCETEFIIFMDDDDLCLPHMVTSLVRARENSGADVIVAPPVPFAEADRMVSNLQYPHPTGPIDFCPLGGPVSVFPMLNMMGGPVALHHVQTLRAVGGYSELHTVGFEDMELHLRMKSHGLQVEVFSEPLYLYEGAKESMGSATPIRRGKNRILRAVDPRVLATDLLDLASLVAGKEAVNNESLRLRISPDGTHLNDRFDRVLSAKTVPQQFEALAQLAHAFSSRDLADAVERSQVLFEELHGNPEPRLSSLHSTSSAVDPLWEALLDNDPEQGDECLLQALHQVLQSNGALSADQIDAIALVDWSRDRPLDAPLFPMLWTLILAGMESNSLEQKIDRCALLVRVASSFSRHVERNHAFGELVQAEDEQYALWHPGVAEGVPQYFHSVLEHYVRYGNDEGRRGFTRSTALLSEMGISSVMGQDGPMALLEWTTSKGASLSI